MEIKVQGIIDANWLRAHAEKLDNQVVALHRPLTEEMKQDNANEYLAKSIELKSKEEEFAVVQSEFKAISKKYNAHLDNIVMEERDGTRLQEVTCSVYKGPDGMVYFVSDGIVVDQKAPTLLDELPSNSSDDGEFQG